MTWTRRRFVRTGVVLASGLWVPACTCDEATNRRNPATVHGAYESGLRVADEVAEALSLG